MTKEKLLKKARYFGSSVGMYFIYKNRLVQLLQVYLKSNNSECIITFEKKIKEESGILYHFKLPEDIKLFNDIKKAGTCKKRTFNSYRTAENYLLRSTFNDDEFSKLSIYQCNKCGKWHFTSNGFSKILRKYKNEIKKAKKL